MGPYSWAEYGACMYGHPVNSHGRCHPMDYPYIDPATRREVGCPNRQERSAYLSELADGDLMVFAGSYGITWVDRADTIARILSIDFDAEVL